MDILLLKHLYISPNGDIFALSIIQLIKSMKNLKENQIDEHKNFASMTDSEKQEYYQSEIDSLNSDLELAQSMTEQEAQNHFNVDSKSEIISMLNDYLKSAQESLECISFEDDDFDNNFYGDPAFSSEEDYNNYKFR